MRVGSGIFVAEPRAVTFPAQGDEGPNPFDLLAARHLIEGEIAALAARAAKKGDLAAMRATVVRMREHATDFRKRDAADQEFHVRIAAATGNGSLPLVVQGLWQQRRGKLWERIETYFHTQKMRDGVLLDHTAIIDAIEQRDADTARAAMHKHLARVEREFQRQWDVIVPEEGAGSGARRTAVLRKRNPNQQSAT